MEGYEGVNAANLAAVLQMDRANVSKELNRLVQEKVVVKVIGRPVYYFDAKILQEDVYKRQVHIRMRISFKNCYKIKSMNNYRSILRIH